MYIFIIYVDETRNTFTVTELVFSRTFSSAKRLFTHVGPTISAAC